MSVSKVDICNFALQEIGEESIISLSDDTVQAQQCNLRYDTVRRAMLEMHPWNFALTRQSLALTNDTDPFGDFNSVFQLPSNCLRVLATDRELDVNFGTDPLFNGYKTIGFQNSYTGKDRYKIEGRKLYYDDDVCKVLYIKDEEDTTVFSPLFVEGCSLYLSSRIAYKITGSRTLQAEQTQLFREWKREAALRDAQEGTTERSEVSRFVSVRF